MDEQIARIMEKLRLLRWKTSFAMELPFGVAAHRYRMKRCISVAAIEAFEESHGIRLPEGYRRFLLEVGNGGAGPYFGILPLEKWNCILYGQYDLEPEEESRAIAASLVAPFPMTENSTEAEWQNLLNRTESPYEGTIAVCDQGCTYKAVLVVTGSERGRVCNIDEDWAIQPYFAPFADFLSWYEAWLDRGLNGEKFGWFGHIYDESGLT